MKGPVQGHQLSAIETFQSLKSLWYIHIFLIWFIGENLDPTGCGRFSYLLFLPLPLFTLLFLFLFFVLFSFLTMVSKPKQEVFVSALKLFCVFWGLDILKNYPLCFENGRIYNMLFGNFCVLCQKKSRPQFSVPATVLKQSWLWTFPHVFSIITHKQVKKNLLIWCGSMKRRRKFISRYRQFVSPEPPARHVILPENKSEKKNIVSIQDVDNS